MLEKIDTPETDRKIIEIPVPRKNMAVGNTFLHTGVTLWEIDPKKRTCTPATFKVSAMEVQGSERNMFDGVLELKQELLRHTAIYKAENFYVLAINKKNAWRKYYQAARRLSASPQP